MAVADKQVWVLGEPRISDNVNQIWVLGEVWIILDGVVPPAVPENTVYLVKATGKRTQLAEGAVAIRIDPTTGRRSLDTTLTKYLVREDDGTLRAKSA